eukprot:4330344-Ditylum_brightwellii.AAC.1
MYQEQLHFEQEAHQQVLRGTYVCNRSYFPWCPHVGLARGLSPCTGPTTSAWNRTHALCSGR